MLRFSTTLPFRQRSSAFALNLSRRSTSSSFCSFLSSSTTFTSQRYCSSSSSSSSSMGKTFAEAGYSDNLVTPSFGDIGSMPTPPDLGPIDTQPATDVDIPRDLHGPWIFLAGSSNLEGELFIRPDGVVHFRPGNCLGYGIGRLKLSHTSTGAAVADIELEHYLYEMTSKDPPLLPKKTNFVVAFSIASAPNQNYKTFTMHGQAMDIEYKKRDNENEPEEEIVTNVGSVNAAKLEPWNPYADENKNISENSEKNSENNNGISNYEWKPNPQISQGFKVLFPRPFNLERLSYSSSSSSSSTKSNSLFNLKTHEICDPKYKVGSIDSVFYIPDYITESEEENCLKQNEETPPELKNALDRRTVQEYGGSMCEVCKKSFVSDANIPPWCNTLCKCVVQDGIFNSTTFPNNVRIHDYYVGNGIAPHIDGPIYVPRVAILSLASSVVMSFYPKQQPYSDVMQHYEDTFKFEGNIAQQKPLFSLVLEPRSLLIFEKDAYNFYPHGISANEVDSLDENINGPIANRHLWKETPQDATEIVRKHRVGVTIRNLLPRCSHEPSRAEYQILEAYKVQNPNAVEKFCESPIASKEILDSKLMMMTNNSNNNIIIEKSSSQQEQEQEETNNKNKNYYGAMSKQQSESTTSSNTTATTKQEQKENVEQIQKQFKQLEFKMNELSQQQKSIEKQLKEISTLLAFNTQRNVKFENDTAAILDHVSQLLLDVQAKVEDIDEKK